jgi:hypothetical protein
MTTYTYEMKMPAEYTKLTADEMEYDGGFLDKLLPSAVAIVGIVGGASVVLTGCAIAVTTGWTGVGALAGGGVAVFGVATMYYSFMSLLDVWK